MKLDNLEIKQWADRGNDLLNRTHLMVSNAPSERVRALATRVPQSIVSDDSKIKMVFAGQYSAGKSTLLKALLNREDISTGAAIVTDESKTYEWGDLLLTDTPGVHTQLRPDHDEITYRAIAESDLLVFVVTNELFDSYLAEHFRKLAIDRDKVHEMILVVNKMQRTSSGNSPEAQETIRVDLEKVLTPYSPEDLNLTFTDAETALDAKSETNPELVNILIRKSGLHALEHNLNQVARERGLAARYTTSLYELEQVLQEALVLESTGDTDVDALEELLLQRRKALLEATQTIPYSVDKEIQSAVSRVRKEGTRIANMIDASADTEKVNKELQKAQDQIEEIAETLGKAIQTAIAEDIEEIGQRIEQIINSELGKELFPRLVHKVEQVDISPENMAKLKKAGEMSDQLGRFLIKHSFKPSAGAGLKTLFKLEHYSGTEAHTAVKAIGKVFGKKFKPWEAVKWTKGVANAGRVLAVAGVALTFILQVKEDANEDKLELELRESRVAIRAGFNDAAHAIEMHYDKSTNTYVQKTLETEIAAIDEQLEELRSMQRNRSHMFQDLVKLSEETSDLIQELHSA